METDPAFCREQAAACRQAADGATLGNERDKFLKAAASWSALATKNDDMKTGYKRRMIRLGDVLPPADF